MKTPIPKKGDGKSIVKCGRSKGSVCITTPEKGKISRHFQSLGGESVRGAAAATARKFSLSNPSSSGGSLVKNYDQEIRDRVASRVNRRSTGRPKKLNADIEAKIIDACGLTMTPGPTAKWRKIWDYHCPHCTDGWRNEDCAAKALETDGWCNQEGQKGHGARRVCEDELYAPLRARLRIL
jgi:hypothetical protein